MHTQLQPKHGFTNPFADPRFIAARKAEQDREARLKRQISCDAAGLVLHHTEGRSDNGRLPKPILAYRILLRCALLAKEYAHEYYEPEYALSIKRMSRMPDRGVDRLLALQVHTGKLFESTRVAVAIEVLPLLWREILPAICRLTSTHWHLVLSSAALCSSEKCNGDTSLSTLLRISKLRRIATSAGRTTKSQRM